MTVVFAIVLVVHGAHPPARFRQSVRLGRAAAVDAANLAVVGRPVARSRRFCFSLPLDRCSCGRAGGGPSARAPLSSRWWRSSRRGRDAKFGALANLIALVGVVFGFLAQGPASLRAAYERDVDRALARVAPAEPVADADLAHLPAPVQRYLRTTGVVGQPRVHNFRARMHGRIRNGPEARWMPLAAEQYNGIDEPARLFYLTGSMFTIPVQGYHRYVGPSATMRVKAAALVPVVDVSGHEMNQGETVTMFNDMCVMAPATLIDPAIVWEPVDARTARASFTNARPHDSSGALVQRGWRVDELLVRRSLSDIARRQDREEGAVVHAARPLSRVRAVRLASGGEGRWHEPGQEYTYIELTIDDVQYNVRSR